MKTITSNFTRWIVRMFVILGTVDFHSAAADLSKFPLEPCFELPPDVASDVIPLRWSCGAPLVPVNINGQDAGWFMIGTTHDESYIDHEVAGRLGLPEISDWGYLTEQVQELQGKTNLLGATNKFRVDTLRCGSAVVSDARFCPGDLKKIYDPGDFDKGISEPALRVSGILGWNLLKTLPFLLDEPGLQLVWQKTAIPPDGAIQMMVSERQGRIQRRSHLQVEVTLGSGLKTQVGLDSGFSGGIAIRHDFIRLHSNSLWHGRKFIHVTEITDPSDDDDLPLDYKRWFGVQTGHWLEWEYGGLKGVLPFVGIEDDHRTLDDVRLGYGLLRRMQVLFDGPGKEIWLKPSATTPEVSLLGSLPPEESKNFMTSILCSAICMNDPGAVRALLDDNLHLKCKPQAHEFLNIACRRGSREVAKLLIEAGVSAEPPKDSKSIPLFSACGIGDAEMIRILLKHGADPNRTVQRFSPLGHAAASGNPEAVKALEGDATFPKEVPERFNFASNAAYGGNYPLFLKWISTLSPEELDPVDWPPFLEGMLLAGHQEIVEWVIHNRGKEIVRRKVGLPPLIAAIIPTRIEKSDARREKMVEILLAAGAEPNAACKGITPLLLAARHGNGAIVKRLLAAGANVSAKDYKQRNALMRAALAQQPVDMVKLLLQAGSDPNDVDAGLETTPLSLYAQAGNVEACRILLEAGAAANGDPMFSSNPLISALHSGSTAVDEDRRSVVSLLLEHGAKVTGFGSDSASETVLITAIITSRASLIQELAAALRPPFKPDSKEMTNSLTRACIIADPATIRTVLAMGVNPTKSDENGVIPLAAAASAGNVSNIMVLLDQRVSPDAEDPNAVPPIWMAASYGQTRALRLLLAAGANPNAVHPVKKTTPLQVTRSRRDMTIVDLLEKAGAR